jgi:hypothetical protein
MLYADIYGRQNAPVRTSRRPLDCCDDSQNSSGAALIIVTLLMGLYWGNGVNSPVFNITSALVGYFVGKNVNI